MGQKYELIRLEWVYLNVAPKLTKIEYKDIMTS